MAGRQSAGPFHRGFKKSRLFTAESEGASDLAGAGLERDCPALHDALPVTLTDPD